MAIGVYGTSDLNYVAEKPPPAAIKHDGDKPRYDLIPFDALDSIVKVLTFGADKYGAGNWEKGFAYGRLLGATLRHVTAFARGEDLDLETKMPHLAHAASCLLMLLALTLRKGGEDDRSKI